MQVRAFSDATADSVIPKSGGGIFRRVLTGLGLGSRPTLAGANSLLFNCKDVADHHSWYNEGLIGEEFRSKHHLIMLHCWLVHKRLIVEGSRGKTVQEAMFDELWEDTSNRIRGVGVNELSVNKHLKEVQGSSFRYCLELDEALTKEHNDEILEEVGGALWRYNFVRNDDVEVDHVMAMAEYVFREYESLQSVGDTAICEGRIQFGELPEWPGASVRVDGSGMYAEGKAPDAGEWKQAISNDGRVYWWNTQTRESRWTLPKQR